jgi:hypothetical protein
MNSRKKLLICLSLNSIILTISLSCAFLFGETSSYWQIGYNEELTILSVKINSLEKYIFLIIFISIINVSKVAVDNVAMPILNFSIYNPDKKTIFDLSKNELILFGNSIYLVTNLRRLLLTLISISQIDLALWSIISSQIFSAYVINSLLNEKIFQNKEILPI